MRRILFIILCIIIAGGAEAQKKQTIAAYTKVRSNSGGDKLPGVFVKIEGDNEYETGSDGKFVFDTGRDGEYTIEDVSKKGYELDNKGFVIGETKYYSRNTERLFLTSVAEEKALQERIQANAAKEAAKVYKTQVNELSDRIDELERLQEDNESVRQELQDCREQLAILHAQKEKEQKLLDFISEQWASRNYADIEAEDKRIGYLIENGEYQEVEKLLPSKEELERDIKAYRLLKESNRADSMVVKQLKSLDIRCSAKAVIHALKNEHTEAAYYLEQRAKLDPTNIEWQCDFGNYVMTFLADYNRVLEFYEDVLPIVIKIYGEQSQDTATLYNNIGAAYSNRGEHDKALEYCFKALTIEEKVLGTEHPDIAMSYSSIGVVYGKKNEYKKALEYANKALSIIIKIYGPQHNETALLYNNIGVLYLYLKEIDKAIEYITMAMNIRESELLCDNIDLAISFNSLGAVYIEKKEYDSALNYINKALLIQEKILGTEHPDTAISYTNIGVCYHYKGNYNKALEYYNKASAILEKVYGLTHYDVINLYNSIIRVYLSKAENAKPEDAILCYNHAITTIEHVLGEDNIKVASLCNDIGCVLYDCGRYEFALEYLKKALIITEKNVGPLHTELASMYCNVGTCYISLGNIGEALRCLYKAQDIWEKVEGPSYQPLQDLVMAINMLETEYGDNK